MMNSIAPNPTETVSDFIGRSGPAHTECAAGPYRSRPGTSCGRPLYSRSAAGLANANFLKAVPGKDYQGYDWRRCQRLRNVAQLHALDGCKNVSGFRSVILP